VGFLDDYLKVVKKYPKGLIGRYKLLGQFLWGSVVGLAVTLSSEYSGVHSYTTMPFLKNFMINFGVFYIPMVILLIAGTSNAVNLTDGLDGLAIGLVGIAALSFAGMSYVTGRVDFSRYLSIFYLKGAGELTVYCAALIGAAMGFLWYNSYPASVFMGDTGALALGGALGTLAVLLKKEIILLVVGGVFWAENISVILQVASYRWRGGKRIFRMAPLHHHFELLGWPEEKIVVRFWIMGILLALLSLGTFKIR
jgi:phospho-N-acetylmuramoyl-pentapeptide-transferase